MEIFFSSIIDWLNKAYNWVADNMFQNNAVSFDGGFPSNFVSSFTIRIGISFLVALGLLVASVVLIGTFENRILKKRFADMVLGVLFGFYSILFIFSGVFMDGIRVFDFRFMLLALVGTAYGPKRLLYMAIPYLFVSYINFGYPLVDIFILIYAILISFFPSKKDFKAILLLGGILPVALLEKPIRGVMTTLSITPVVIFGLILIALIILLGGFWIIVVRNKSLSILTLQKYIWAILHNNSNICHFKIDKRKDWIKISKSYYKIFEINQPVGEYEKFSDFINTFDTRLLATPDLVSAKEIFSRGLHNLYVNTAITHSSQNIEVFSKRTIFGRRKGILVNTTNVIDSGEMVLEMQKIDFLTGLKTSYVIRDDISQKARRQKGLVLQIHISLADLNRHTSLFGVDFYNNALKAIAVKLRDVFKDMDIYSFKNGEFHLVHYGLVSVDEANKFKDRVYNVFNAPIEVSGRDIKVLVTTGLKISESNEASTLEGADRCVAKTIWSQIKASEMGQNHSYIFNEERYNYEQMRSRRIEKLPSIIKEKQFRTVYQPIVNAKTGQLFSFEALSNVDNSIYENISLVIKDAMFCNMSSDLDNALLECLLKDLKSKSINGVNLFVNILPNTPFLPIFLEINKHQEENRGKFYIEFTEYDKADTSYLLHFINQLRSHGINVALDDYGAGYASPNFLLSISPNVVKLDMELIKGIYEDKNKAYLVSTIVNYCKESKILCLAEGVDNVKDMRKMIELGIDLLQGYYIGKPSPIPQMISEEITKEILSYSTINEGDF